MFSYPGIYVGGPTYPAVLMDELCYDDVGYCTTQGEFGTQDWVQICFVGRPVQEQEGPGMPACTGAVSPGE